MSRFKEVYYTKRKRCLFNYLLRVSRKSVYANPYFKRFPVIHITRTKNKVQKFQFSVDNQMYIETAEPTDGVLPFFGDVFKGLMLFLSFM